MIKPLILSTIFIVSVSLNTYGQNNGKGSANNPYDNLYINKHLKVGTNSIWIDAGADNRLFTTSGPLMINGNWPSSGPVPAALGLNTLINPTGGHVGIGSVTPKAKLDVEINTSYYSVHESGLRVTYPNLFGAPTTGGPNINESIFEVREKFPASGTYNSRLIVKSNGNVGISSDDPKYKLQVVNPSLTLGTAIRADAINGQVRLFETDGSNPNTDFTQIERNGNAFHIYQFDASGHTQVLSATQNGNVGIGTTSPSSKLHIVNSSSTLGTAIKAEGVNGHIRLFETDGSNPSTDYTQIERNSDAFHIYQKGATGFIHALTATQDGEIGIGTSSPQSKLHVSNGVLQIDGAGEIWSANNWKTRIKSPISSAWVTTVPSTENNRYMGIGMTNAGWYFIQSDDPSGTSSNPACYPFFVTQNGKVVTREVQVTLNGWCDYVFDDEYELKGLEEVKSYISTNKHLPEVPSEKEVLENGVNLGDMDAILLKKIEELMLYTIQQEEKIKKQQEQIDLLIEKSNQ